MMREFADSGKWYVSKCLFFFLTSALQATSSSVPTAHNQISNDFVSAHPMSGPRVNSLTVETTKVIDQTTDKKRRIAVTLTVTSTDARAYLNSNNGPKVNDIGCRVTSTETNSEGYKKAMIKGWKASTSRAAALANGIPVSLVDDFHGDHRCEAIGGMRTCSALEHCQASSDLYNKSRYVCRINANLRASRGYKCPHVWHCIGFEPLYPEGKCPYACCATK